MPVTAPSMAARSVMLPVNDGSVVPAAAHDPVVPVTVPMPPGATATTPCWIARAGSAIDLMTAAPCETSCCWTGIVVSWVDCPSRVSERWSAKGRLPTVSVNVDFDAAAGERRGRVVAEAEEDGVAGVGAHRIDRGRIGVGVAGAVVPLPGARDLAPGDAGQVEQRQREVGAQGEAFVVAGGEVVGQAEGDDVSGTQLPIRRRRAAIDRHDGDGDLVGRYRQRGR